MNSVSRERRDSKVQKKNSRGREKEEESEELEVKEETIPNPPAQLWHQEGAQQLRKAEPRRSKEVDRALATVHLAPPLLEKRNRVNTCFLFARSRRLRAPGAPPR